MQYRISQLIFKLVFFICNIALVDPLAKKSTEVTLKIYFMGKVM